MSGADYNVDQDIANSPYPPGHIGIVAYPADISSQLPTNPQGVKQPEPVGYRFVNPKKFADRIANVNADILNRGVDRSGAVGLAQVDTELQGLQHFAPAAAALKRDQISVDNQFNQQQRLNQLNTAMPGAREALAAQGKRAAAYAEGRLPDAVQNSALELGIRSQAADAASAGGFGVKSAASAKSSDLMSAQQRLGIAQYGEELTSKNLSDTAQLTLSPTEYSDAGTDIKAVPEVGAGRAAAQFRQEYEQSTMLSPGDAYQGTIQQRQFQTQLAKENAQMALQASEFNASAANSFAQRAFSYKQGLANQIAAAAQENANAQINLANQQNAQDAFNNAMHDAQDAQTGAAIGQAVGVAAGIAASYYGSSGTPQMAAQTSGLNGKTAAEEHSSGTAVPRAAIYQNSSAVPKDHVVVAQSDNGSVSAAPKMEYQKKVTNLRMDTGIDAGDSDHVAAQSMLAAGTTLNNAGISYAPAPGQQAIGVDHTGQTLYSNTQLAKNTSRAGGAKLLAGFDQAFSSLGLTTDERKELGTYAKSAASDRMHSRLDNLAGTKDGKGFVKASLSAMGVGQGKDHPELAYAAHQLYQVWGRLSPAQKSLSLASLASQGMTKRVGPRTVPGTAGGRFNGFSMGEAAQMLNKGINAYTLADDWDTFNDLHTLQHGKVGSAAEVAETAKSMIGLGKGTNGREVQNIDGARIARMGWKPAPGLGIGALASMGSNARVPQGYVRVSPKVIVPTGTSHTAPGEQDGSLVGSAVNSRGIADSVQRIYHGWGNHQTFRPSRGLVGGSAVIGGLAKLTPWQQAELAHISISRNWA